MEGQYSIEGYDRVRAHTGPKVNERIDRMGVGSVASYTGRDPEVIARRLAALDREWDIDRAIMALFPVVGGLTSYLGQRRRLPRYLFRAQLGFLLLHAVVGWCPPVAVLRRLGFRTSKEIAAEQQAVRALLHAATAH